MTLQKTGYSSVQKKRKKDDPAQELALITFRPTGTFPAIHSIESHYQSMFETTWSPRQTGPSRRRSSLFQCCLSA